MIAAIQPNPVGKDKGQNLYKEWVDITNTNTSQVDLSRYSIWHNTYDEDGNPTDKVKELMNFSGVLLKAGGKIRVHSGPYLDLTKVDLLEWLSADVHVFTRDRYAWNNLEGDSPHLGYRDSSGSLSWADWAQYVGPVSEGAVLYRVPGTHTLA